MSKRMQNFHGSKKRKKPGTSSKKRRHCRPQPSYYIHQTDNDMLLLISNDLGSEDLPQGLNKRARRCLDAPVSEIQHIASPESTTDHGWGSAMPLEILQKIFQLLADSEGSVPTLCRLSLLSDFSLHHWKEHVPFVVKSLSASCPLLSSLTLSHCSGVTSDALLSAASNCAQLQSLNLQNSQVESLAVLGTFEVCGSRLQRLFLTYSNKSSAILSSLSNGSCSNLKILELNTEIKQGESHLQICIEALQSGCPKLEVLRLLNLVWSPKSGSRCSPEAPGFVELHELCLATSSYSFVSDTVCQKLLRDSSKLQVLDLRGCYRVTPEGICKLPCTDLQRLYLGLYCSTKNLALPRSGCALLVRRWQHSLQELDLTAQSYSEEDLAQALDVLCRGGVNESLSSLNLAGTKVTAPAVRELLSSCPSLTHLDLSSCRYLPRGMKRVYRSTEEICKCLQGLLEGLEVAPEEEACM
ncbi:F-box/LRR-repeat protein 6 isoform X2 [Bombina bombina]|uniref:F-box/LRR-repeat protein 6 isoform X2 n=1 Tax=Bombina bombina TaxID=8345 RepID=UPI00235A4A3C|nr:F-box/LRR-repeat protein 6 isoform X2 [Bombina bombina]